MVDRARLEFAPCVHDVHKVSRPLDCEPSDMPANDVRLLLFSANKIIAEQIIEEIQFECAYSEGVRQELLKGVRELQRRATWLAWGEHPGVGGNR